MSNTKLIIDKEDWDKIASEFNSNDLPTVTEIQIDQSIEERAETILKEHTGCEGVYLRKGEHFGETVIEAMVELATSQQIIEQLRVKEKESDIDNLMDLIKSDSVYTLLRYGVKSPSSSGVDDCEDDKYYELYNLSTKLRTK